MENKELRERMLSGKMYNDLSVELVQRREQAVFLTNDYNSTYREKFSNRCGQCGDKEHSGECNCRRCSL